MSHNPNLKHDEIDLRELLATLWSHKILITLFTSLSIFLAGNYSLTSEKLFTANAMFQIEEITGGSGFNISGELSVLASLAGVGGKGANTSSDILLERASGREFIVEMNKSSQFIKIIILIPTIQTTKTRYGKPL